MAANGAVTARTLRISTSATFRVLTSTPTCSRIPWPAPGAASPACGNALWTPSRPISDAFIRPEGKTLLTGRTEPYRVFRRHSEVGRAAIGVEIVVGALCIAITASEHARARPSATDGRRPKCLTFGFAPQVRSTPPVFDAPRIRFDDGHVAIRTACEAPTPPCVPPNAVRFVFHGPPELPLVSLRRVRQDSGGPAFVCALQLS